MKKHILLFLLLISFGILNAQNDSIKEVSLEIGAKYQVALGDNYLNDGYQNSPGFGIAIQNNLKKNIFIGAFFNYYKTKITDANLIGDFNKSSSFYLGAYLGFRHKILTNKYFLEHKISYGYKSIDNINENLDYRISGKPISIGSKINYNLKNDFTLFFGTDFIYFKNDVNLTGPYRNFYVKSFIIEPSIGIRFNFGACNSF